MINVDLLATYKHNAAPLKRHNTNVKGQSLHDSLEAAICNDEPESMIEWLHRNGVDINRTIRGSTALYHAARANKVEAVKCLLNLGADPSLSKGDGHSPLDIAIKKGHTGIADMIKSHLPNKPSFTKHF